MLVFLVYAILVTKCYIRFFFIIHVNLSKPIVFLDIIWHVHLKFFSVGQLP